MLHRSIINCNWLVYLVAPNVMLRVAYHYREQQTKYLYTALYTQDNSELPICFLQLKTYWLFHKQQLQLKYSINSFDILSFIPILMKHAYKLCNRMKKRQKYRKFKVSPRSQSTLISSEIEK